MEATEMILRSLEQSQEYMTGALDGLTQEEVAWSPGAECNSIAFILWHMTRVEDFFWNGVLQHEDEIYEADSGTVKNEPTTVAQAQRFLAETGVDILVPNVGTEHRATVDEVEYNSQRAREISAAVGNILCLHGTSSLGPASLAKLPGDGFIKVNIYTTLAVNGGQAVAQHLLNNLGNVFTEAHLDELVAKGVIGEVAGSPDFGDNELPIKPKLAVVANPSRRDAWFAAVCDRCKEFLDMFRYQRYAQ